MEIDLVELIKSRDEAGIVLLKDEFSGLMHYIVTGILSNSNDVEECISDVLLKVWQSIETYDAKKSKFSTWLTVISRNTALNYVKKNHKNHGELSDETPDKFSLEKEILRKEQMKELSEAVKKLSSEEQNIFYRKYYYLQMTSKIAKELGMTERSVEGKLYRLRKKLQKRLGGDFIWT